MTRLAQEVRDGDLGAADRLFGLARPRLLRIALAAGIDPEEAADAVQETLLSAHRNLRRFDPSKGSFEGWTGTALLRRVRNRRRSAGRLRRLLEAFRLQAPGSSTEGHSAAEARMTLRRLVEDLTRRQREVIALYEIGGLGAAEVAGILEMTPAGVRSIARDARKRLSEAARRKEGES
jgi:RNA polymerase sigma-70 factor (ECF subfamily)